MDQLRSTVRRLEDCPERFALGFHLFLQQLCVAHDDREQVIEVVGDATGELPHGRHLLCLAQLVLNCLAIGNVRLSP